MFGFFGSKEDEQRAYDDLLDFLSEDWNMKEQYARAFLDAYRRSLAKIHKNITKKYEELRSRGNAEMRLALHAMGGKRDALAHMLIAQAYNGYKNDLRSRKHVGTDVELAIWGILANRSDLLNDFDESFAMYIRDNYEKKFPHLFDELFSTGS